MIKAGTADVSFSSYYLRISPCGLARWASLGFLTAWLLQPECSSEQGRSCMTFTDLDTFCWSQANHRSHLVSRGGDRDPHFCLREVFRSHCCMWERVIIICMWESHYYSHLRKRKSARVCLELRIMINLILFPLRSTQRKNVVNQIFCNGTYFWKKWGLNFSKLSFHT